MAVSVSIQAENVEELRALFALLGSVALPASATGLSVNTPVSSPPANDTAASDKPRTRRTTKPEEATPNAAPAAPPAAAGDEAVVATPAGGDQTSEPDAEHVETPDEQPAETGGAAGAEAGAAAGDDAEPDLGKAARDKLRAVMTKYTPADMHAILKKFSVTAVKDIPTDKLPAVIAECDAKLAA